MARDLSKVKEIHSTDIDGAVMFAEAVNNKLKTGKWVLLEVRVVECCEWKERSTNQEAHLHKKHKTICVIGRIK